MIAFSKVSFSFRHGWLRPRVKSVLRQIDWAVSQGEAVALVGPSGSGKSTIVRLALGLLRPGSGTVRIDGIEPGSAKGDQARHLHRTIQWVPQHPDAAFDPRMSMETSLCEALSVHGIRAGVADNVIGPLIDRMSLSKRLLSRRPGELSGGEVQRFALARALSLKPKLIMLDEPTSMLDVSVQAGIIRLILDLRRERDLTMVLVTHDLALARHVTSRIDRIEAGAFTPSGS